MNFLIIDLTNDFLIFDLTNEFFFIFLPIINLTWSTRVNKMILINMLMVS